MDQKTFKINNIEFIIEELTLEELESLLALMGQLKLDVSFKDIKDVAGIMSGLVGIIGEVGQAELLRKMLSIVLKKKDSREKVSPEFFAKAKRTEIFGALQDFFTGEGSSIFTGIKDLTTSIFGKTGLTKITNP